MSKTSRIARTVGRAALGLDALSYIGRSAAAPAVVAGLLLKVLWRAMQPAKQDRWLADVDDAGERFRLAEERYQVTDHSALLARLRRNWILNFCAAVGLLALGIVNAPGAIEKHGWFIGLIFAFAAVPVFAALTFQAAFLHWQVRTRRLAGVGEWLRLPREWLPTAKILSLVAMLGAAALFPGAASAETAAASSDIALNIVNTILPVSGATASGTALSAGLGVFVAALMGITAAMMIYQIVVGQVNTAWEGKFLGGGKWHQVWAPIRVSIGFSLMPPVVNGWPAGVFLIYQLAVGSCTLANNVWSASLAYLLSPAGAASTAAAGIPSSISGAVLASQVLKSEVCAAIDTDLASQIGIFGPLASAPAVGGTFVASDTAADGSGTQVFDYKGGCGGFGLPVPAKASPGPMMTYSTARITALSNLISAIRQSGLASQIAGAQTVMSDGTIIWPTSIYPTLRAAGKTYESAMLSASATYIANQNQTTNNNLQASGISGGWMTAFSYQRPLAVAGQQIGSMASQAPTWAAPTSAEASGFLTSQIGGPVQKLYRSAEDRIDSQVQAERPNGLKASDLAAGAQAQNGWLDRILEPLDHRMSQAVIDWSAPSSTDAIGDLMNEGTKLNSAGEAGVVASLAMTAIACNEVGRLAGACDTAKESLTMARPLFWGAIAAGTTLQFLLPMQVWIAGLWLETSWIIALAQVVICVPIFGFLMSRMDGQELIDHVQRPFIIILANWFLLPTLSVLGFDVFLEMAPIGIGLIKQGFSAVFVGSQGGHYQGVLGTIAAVGVQSYLCYQMTIRLAQIIIIFTKEIPALLGAPGGGAIGDAADSLREGNRTLAVIANNTAQTGQRLGGGGSASKIPKSGGGGGGEAPGLRVGGDGGGGDDGGGDGGGSASKISGGDEPHWGTATSGGLEALSDSQRAAAAEDHKKWQADTGLSYSLASYVDHAQKREAAKRHG